MNTLNSLLLMCATGILLMGSLTGCGGGAPPPEQNSPIDDQSLDGRTDDELPDEPQLQESVEPLLLDVHVNSVVVGQAQWGPDTRLWQDTDRVLEVTEDRVVLALSDGESLDIGDILVGQGPDGSFSGRMVSVTQGERDASGISGEVVTIELQAVTVEEMFEQISISLRNHPVKASGLQPATGGTRVLIDNDVVRVAASASFQLDPSPDFDVDLDLDFFTIIPTGVEEFRAIFTAGVANQVEVNMEVKKPFSNQRAEKVVKEIEFDPIGVTISGITLEICPTMKILVGFAGSSVGTGTISLNGVANASTRIGIDCPEGEDCDGLFEFPFNADVNLDSRIRGGGASFVAYSRAEFKLDILCSPTLASTTLMIQPQMEVGIEQRPSRSAPPFAECDGLLTPGNQRARMTVDAGVNGKVVVDLTLIEEEFPFDIVDERVFNDCEIFLAEPPELAPVEGLQDTAAFTAITAQIIELEPDVEVTETVDTEGEVAFRLGNNGDDAGTLRCRCPQGSFGACLGSFPIDGGPATCEFECEDSGGHALPCTWVFTPSDPGFTSGFDFGGGRLAPQ